MRGYDRHFAVQGKVSRGVGTGPQDRKPIRVTRRGTPVADVLPPAPEKRSDDWLGAMAGTGRITGDIVAATGNLVDWDPKPE